jgi:hypothetical protein
MGVVVASVLGGVTQAQVAQAKANAARQKILAWQN